MADADQRIHFGFAPWHALQVISGMPAVTWFLDAAYSIWFFALWAMYLFFAFSVHFRQLRGQFLLAHILCWILLGNVAATLMSSVGPCYYAKICRVDSDRFIEPVSYLHESCGGIAIGAVLAQDWLWENYVSQSSTFAAGISAMPSMHVSMAWLMMLAAYRLHRWLGHSLLVYALLILIGSVHLNWHYAVDGYVAILGTSLIWVMVGKYQARRQQGSTFT